MNKLNQQTTSNMLQLVDLSTYDGRITYLAISFLCQTGATFDEASRLTVGDVYSYGRPKKWVRMPADLKSSSMTRMPTAEPGRVLRRLSGSEHRRPKSAGAAPFRWQRAG